MRRRDPLTDLTNFVAVADHLSFRRAAVRLELTSSALSHSIGQLEKRLGVRLLHRTTRSVSLTDAGLRLLEKLRPGLDQVSQALEDLKAEVDRPLGRLRIYTTHLAAAAVIAPVWARYLATFPDVRLEVEVGEPPIDIVVQGFDAGIGPKDRAEMDMIAVRVTEPLKVAVVGAPAYFARRRPPRAPDDLGKHDCVEYRRPPKATPMEWALERGGKSRRITVKGRVTVNNVDLALRAAVDGLGLAYTVEGLAQPFLRSGQLVRVLEDWSPCVPGLFLYYSGHRQVPAALRALIDMIRADGTRSKSSLQKRVRVMNDLLFGA